MRRLAAATRRDYFCCCCRGISLKSPAHRHASKRAACIFFSDEGSALLSGLELDPPDRPLCLRADRPSLPLLARRPSRRHDAHLLGRSSLVKCCSSSMQSLESCPERGSVNLPERGGGHTLRPRKLVGLPLISPSSAWFPYEGGAISALGSTSVVTCCANARAPVCRARPRWLASARASMSRP